MKAAILHNNKLIISDLPKPKLKDNGAIIRVIGCGLCGSDIVKLLEGNSNEGKVLGHEVVGIIEEINSETNFVIGDKIVLGHHVPCFNCIFCKGENYSMCKQFKETNIFPGGFAEYIYVSEIHLKNTVFKPEKTLSDEQASFLEPLACCVRAVKRAQLPQNSKVLVVGLGSIGILMGQAVKAFGHNSYGCDLYEDRVNLSKKLGFNDSFIYQNDTDTSEQIKNVVSHLGVDAIFMTSGSDKTLDFAIKTVRDGGTIVIFSSIKSNNGFKNNDIYYRELKILGSYSPAPIDLKDSLNLLESCKVNVDGISTDYKLEDINKAIDDTISNKIMKAFIKI